MAILEAMWIWNDYLLPYLTLDLGKYKTISVAVQYLKGGYGSVDMGAMMACLVLAIIPNHHRVLPDLPEVHGQGRNGRCGEGLMQSGIALA